MSNHKNDYTCVVFFQEGKPKKWSFVHGLNGFVNFLNQKHATWKYCNVYERRTGQYLKRFYPGNIVPNFLSLVLFVILSSLLTPAASHQPLNSTFSIPGEALPFFLTFNNYCEVPGRSK